MSNIGHVSHMHRRCRMLSPRQSPMLCIKPLIRPKILNYYISNVILVGQLEPLIVPFHYNCTLCLLYKYQGDLVLGSSYLIMFIQYIVKGGFPRSGLLLIDFLSFSRRWFIIQDCVQQIHVSNMQIWDRQGGHILFRCITEGKGMKET
jgi:hypothetical protein